MPVHVSSHCKKSTKAGKTDMSGHGKRKNGSKFNIVSFVLSIICISVISLGILLACIHPVFQIIEAAYLQMVTQGQADDIVRTKVLSASAISATATGAAVFAHEGEQVNGDRLQTRYGFLRCEEINMNVPVYFGDTEERLLYGVGIYPKGSVPGKAGTTLIAGHDSTYFASLENINEGNYLIFTKDSKQYLYKVRMTEIRKASDGFDLKKDGDQELVLYTCYPFGVSSISREKRFFVYCDFISESKEESVNE